MRRFKGLISLFLIFTMVMSILPTSQVLAEETSIVSTHNATPMSVTQSINGNTTQIQHK